MKILPKLLSPVWGELHFEIIVDRLLREFKVECNQGAPQVNYKETITQTIEHREKYKNNQVVVVNSQIFK